MQLSVNTWHFQLSATYYYTKHIKLFTVYWWTRTRISIIIYSQDDNQSHIGNSDTPILFRIYDINRRNSWHQKHYRALPVGVRGSSGCSTFSASRCISGCASPRSSFSHWTHSKIYLTRLYRFHFHSCHPVIMSCIKRLLVSRTIYFLKARLHSIIQHYCIFNLSLVEVR